MCATETGIFYQNNDKVTKVFDYTPYNQISRKDVDQFKPGQWIPECQLVVQWERKDQKPAQLTQKVELIGAKAPHNFIYLILDPATEGSLLLCIFIIFLCRHYI